MKEDLNVILDLYELPATKELAMGLVRNSSKMSQHLDQFKAESIITKNDFWSKIELVFLAAKIISEKEIRNHSYCADINEYDRTISFHDHSSDNAPDKVYKMSEIAGFEEVFAKCDAEKDSFLEESKARGEEIKKEGRDLWEKVYIAIDFKTGKTCDRELGYTLTEGRFVSLEEDEEEDSVVTKMLKKVFKV